MRWFAVLSVTVAAFVLSSCVAGPSAGERPKPVSYVEWGDRLADLPEVLHAQKLCLAGLEHHRNANMTGKHDKIIEELNMAILLFREAAEYIFNARDRYPEYSDFMNMELDKLYGYIHKCVSKRPYLFEPTDPLNVLRGSLSHEQRQRRATYERKLSRWKDMTGTK